MVQMHFGITWAAWSSGLFHDPESMWNSAEADRPSGQNITGFRNAEVDGLVAAQRTEFDLQKRNDILRKIDAILTVEVPYVLLWNKRGTRLLWWNKFGRPDQPLGKYGDERSAHAYWWYDPATAADLEHARKTGTSLPAEPPVVEWEEP